MVNYNSIWRVINTRDTLFIIATMIIIIIIIIITMYKFQWSYQREMHKSVLHSHDNNNCYAK